MRRILLPSAVLSLAMTALPVAAGEPVLKHFSTEQTEALLVSLKIDYKKIPAKQQGIFYYDFQRGGHNVRLYWFGGKDLMIDAIFGKMPLEEINAWNVRAKFSRACLHKDERSEYTALEANLDLTGGVSEGAIRRFLQMFDEETKSFARFANTSTMDDVILAKLTADKLEAILQELKIDFQKTETNNGVIAYELATSRHKLRLVSHGGDDLMLDAHFPKLPLERINSYNLQRKFIRCVACNDNGKEYTSLAAYLDCAAGVPESVIRHFLREFEEEMLVFAE
ncbi:MAG: YbjN domain-containing protein, partial [Gemmataceae bacterium]|nr:YbjN domain-containing protein [Gemmataceae bacterium]